MWALIVHGGAKEISRKEEQPNRDGCRAAFDAGHAILTSGGSAVDAVEACIRVLEADPSFNAGYGSVQNKAGEIEMSAALMEGKDLNVGAGAIVKGVRHPISVAKAMLYEKPILLGAEGARTFAKDKKLELCDASGLVAPEKAKKIGAHDTVGCIAFDQLGMMAVGSSTGGLEGVEPGRIGDSPQPGCGFYVDNTVGAVTFTGDGEEIARRISAARVIQRLGRGADAALSVALHDIKTVGGTAGGIAMTVHGQMAWDHNTPDFAVAMMNSNDSAPQVFLRKSEQKK